MKELLPRDGIWWTPGNPQLKMAGRLANEGEEVHLHLTLQHAEGTARYAAKPNDYEILYGTDLKGIPVSLLNCLQVGGSSSMSTEHQIIYPNYILIGGHVPPQDKVDGQFAELILTWPDLNRWFFHSGLELTHPPDNIRAFSLKYDVREPIAFTLRDGIEVKFSFGMNQMTIPGPLSGEISFKEVIWLSLKPEHAQDLQYYLLIMEEIKQFFSVCMLEYSEPESIGLLGNFQAQSAPGQVYNPHLTLYRSGSYKPLSHKKPHPMDMLLTYDVVKDDFYAILDSWHALAKKIHPAPQLYLGSLYGQKYIESSFLSMIQSAEVFHRRNYGGTYLTPEEYADRILPVMEAAIPRSLSSEVQTSIRQRMAFCNEYSLGKRLKLMARNHRQIFDRFVREWKDKLRDIVSARNYFTHYSASAQSRPDANDLADFVDILRLLLELEMLAGSGVDLKVLHTQAEKCEKYNWIFHPSRWAR